MDLVNRLRHYMDISQITISQFADRCGIPRPTMSQLMNGRNKRISDEVINKIHNAYPDLSILWLMFGEGEMTHRQNIEISEPQNGQNPDTNAGHSAINQANTAQNYPDRAFTESNPTSDSFENLLFDDPKTEDAAITYMPADEIPSKENILFDSEVTQSPTPQSFQQTPRPTTFIPPMASNDITRTVGSTASPTAAISSPQENQPDTNESKRISISPDAHKKITNIVVFYSDNSFQSFLPDA